MVENNQVTQFQVNVKLSFLVGEGTDAGSAGGEGAIPGTP